MLNPWGDAPSFIAWVVHVEPSAEAGATAPCMATMKPPAPTMAHISWWLPVLSGAFDEWAVHVVPSGDVALLFVLKHDVQNSASTGSHANACRDVIGGVTRLHDVPLVDVASWWVPEFDIATRTPCEGDHASFCHVFCSPIACAVHASPSVEIAELLACPVLLLTATNALSASIQITVHHPIVPLIAADEYVHVTPSDDTAVWPFVALTAHHCPSVSE